MTHKLKSTLVQIIGIVVTACQDFFFSETDKTEEDGEREEVE